MSAQNFLSCFNETESFEGGFVDNPHDPGGATMAGVTQATYNIWRKAMHLVPAAIRTSTVEERQDIYRMYFWNPVQGDRLFDGLDLVMVDTAWGSGPTEAIKLLQSCLKLHEDGILGEETLDEVTHSSPVLITELCAARLAFFQSLSTWKYFGKGWTARLAGIKAKAIAMNVKPPSALVAEVTLKNEPATTLPGAVTYINLQPSEPAPPSLYERIKQAILSELK